MKRCTMATCRLIGAGEEANGCQGAQDVARVTEGIVRHQDAFHYLLRCGADTPGSAWSRELRPPRLPSVSSPTQSRARLRCWLRFAGDARVRLSPLRLAHEQGLLEVRTPQRSRHQSRFH